MKVLGKTIKVKNITPETSLYGLANIWFHADFESADPLQSFNQPMNEQTKNESVKLPSPTLLQSESLYKKPEVKTVCTVDELLSSRNARSRNKEKLVKNLKEWAIQCRLKKRAIHEAKRKKYYKRLLVLDPTAKIFKFLSH